MTEPEKQSSVQKPGELTTKHKAARVVAEVGFSMIPGGALINAITRAAMTATEGVDIKSGDDLSAVRIETERQENEMRRLEAQAKVAQETAIASRIASAQEVQIEEYYEYAGDGKAGFNYDEKGVTLGLSASGKRMSKRVYRFIGTTTPSEIPSVEKIMRED